MTPIDHRGVKTGITAEERALTVREMVNPRSTARDFVRPGHVHPLLAKEGGVLRRAGHTEAAVDLARMAGLKPAGVLIEILNEQGDRANRDDWIAQHFFTGGVMPSHKLIRQYGDLFKIDEQWRWSGRHYQRTAEDWLANFDARRSPYLPELPTIRESGYPLSGNGWFAFYVPAKTPAPIIERISSLVRDALRSPDVKDRIFNTGSIPTGTTPAELAEISRNDAAFWAPVVKASRFKPDD
mgnify:CR=1 FL=1